MNVKSQIHPSAIAQESQVGANTRIWQFVVVLPGATIGESCNICSHCFIENDVVIGNRVTIKNGVQLWNGLRVGDDVFIGPNVTFTNDRYPRSGNHSGSLLSTQIDHGASIGGGATILPGLKLGRNCMVGSGAVVTRSVPPNAVVVGNPARIVGYANATTQQTAVARSQLDPSDGHRGAIASLVRLPLFADIRGSLAVADFEALVPFPPKRFFLVFGVPAFETRGEHAHLECQQFLVCVRGQVSVLMDDGRHRQQALLDRPDLGLHIPPLVWGTQYNWSSDAVLLVLASHSYDPGDYIRDYDQFLGMVTAS